MPSLHDDSTLYAALSAQPHRPDQLRRTIMDTTLGPIPPKAPQPLLDDTIECRDVGSMVIPVSQLHQQMSRRLEQIERELEHLVASKSSNREFGIVGVPEDAAAMSSMRPS